MNNTPNFHSKTCGECAWYTPFINPAEGGFCRRTAWGFLDDLEQSCIGWQGEKSPACPAFVAKETL